MSDLTSPMWIIFRGHEPWLSFYWTVYVFCTQSRPKGTAPSGEAGCLISAFHDVWKSSGNFLQMSSCSRNHLILQLLISLWRCNTFSLSWITGNVATACNFVPKDLTCDLSYHHRLRVSGTMKHAGRCPRLQLKSNPSWQNVILWSTYVICWYVYAMYVYY